MLVHLIPLNDWVSADHDAYFSPPTFDVDGFVHLSTPDQVAIPANALFGDRSDIWMLVLDPERLTSSVRWERGTGGDPAGMMFPHLFGPVDIAAVIALVPYRQLRPGGYRPPLDLPMPDDAVGRASAMEWYVAAARSTEVSWFGLGRAVRNDSFSFSYDHNRVIFGETVTADHAKSVCERELAGLGHWQVYLEAPVDAEAAAQFGAAGWSRHDDLLMIATEAPDAERVQRARGVDVVQVDRGALDGFRIASMRRDNPGITDDGVRQLIERDATTERVCRVVHLAVFDGVLPVARLDLRILGATAAIDDVMTDPAYEGSGLGSALVLAALERAQKSRCDVVFLRADVDDWPRLLYARLGFTGAGSVHVFDRDV